MTSYRYELIVCLNNVKIKRFLGNDVNTLYERFEMWFIKQPYDRNDIQTYVGEIQHAGYKAQ